MDYEVNANKIRKLADMNGMHYISLGAEWDIADGGGLHHQK